MNRTTNQQKTHVMFYTYIIIRNHFVRTCAGRLPWAVSLPWVVCLGPFHYLCARISNGPCNNTPLMMMPKAAFVQHLVDNATYEKMLSYLVILSTPCAPQPRGSKVSDLTRSCWTQRHRCGKAVLRLPINASTHDLSTHHYVVLASTSVAVYV